MACNTHIAIVTSNYFDTQTYIGSVLVSVNPYQDVKMYTPYHMEKYQRVNLYEMPPHV